MHWKSISITATLVNKSVVWFTALATLIQRPQHQNFIFWMHVLGIIYQQRVRTQETLLNQIFDAATARTIPLKGCKLHDQYTSVPWCVLRLKVVLFNTYRKFSNKSLWCVCACVYTYIFPPLPSPSPPPPPLLLLHRHHHHRQHDHLLLLILLNIKAVVIHTHRRGVRKIPEYIA